MPPPQEKSRTYFIQTFGCQMNKNDSEKMAALLEAAGYRSAEDWRAADLVIINTCSVRSNAERRAFGHLGQLKNLKKHKPHLTIVVAGCLPQRDAKLITAKTPFVDLVIGTHNIHRLPILLKGLKQGGNIEKEQNKITGRGLDDVPLTEILPQRCDEMAVVPSKRDKKTPAWVTIMYGCNNFCSYCVVPYVRGREVSRPAADIVKEISAIDPATHKLVTLLGQNVNSYSRGGLDFADLLKLVAGKFPDLTFEFLTNHPKDTTAKVIETVKALPNVLRSFHVPLQAGSDRILKLMNRKYAVSDYIGLIKKIRQALPEAKISTDIIVGFPSETDEEFEQTYKILKELNFHRVNVAAFDPRPGTPAADLTDQVPLPVRQERLQKVLLLVKKPVKSRTSRSKEADQ